MKRWQGRKQGVVWLLSLTMVFAQSGLPSLVLAQSPNPPGFEQTIDQLERLFMALEVAAREIPRDTFDPEAVLDEVDLEAEALFYWVRDNTYLVPYHGALRGPVGVLMDRVGNSLDRALLLSELLQLLGYDTRLARAQLDVEQMQMLLEDQRQLPDREVLGVENPPADPSTFVSNYGLDEAMVESVLELLYDQQRYLADALGERVAEQSAFLLAKLGEESTEDVERRETQLEALRDHWWVQYQEGGIWFDLDPSVPAAEPGEVITPPRDTHTLSTLQELDRTLLHTVQLRLVLECQRAGSTYEITVLESPPLLPANLFGARVALRSVPINWSRDFDLATSDDPGTALRQMLLQQETWVPTLQVGSEFILDRAYTGNCVLSDAREELNALGQLGRSLEGALGGAFDVLSEPAPGTSDDEAATVVTAQWLEYLLHVPGQEEQIIRRQIFDVVGPAARLTGQFHASFSDSQVLAWRSALLGETEILLLPAQLSQPFLEFLTAKRLLAQKDVLLALAAHPDQDALRHLEERAAQLEPLPGGLYALALAREGWRERTGIYLDRTNVLSQHVQTTFDPRGQPLTVVAFDIVVNEVAVHPALADAFSIRLAQGILDTNLEALLSQITCQRLAATINCESLANAAEAFAQLKDEGVDWLRIQSVADLEALALEWPEDALARVIQDIADGYLVMLPDTPLQDVVYAVWWRVDPSSGSILGVGKNGWGDALAEYGMIVNAIGTVSCLLGAKGNRDSIMLCTAGLLLGAGALSMTGAAAGRVAVLAALAHLAGGLG